MSLKMMKIAGGDGPVLICDFCGKRIEGEEARYAKVIWNTAPGDLGTLSDAFVVHNSCDTLMQRRDGMIASSLELDVAIPFLVDNLALDWRQARARADEVLGFSKEFSVMEEED